MDISLEWLNSYLTTPVGAEEAEEALTHAGFPIEETRPLDGDTFMDVEITSNRGDCLSHLGLAREIAASTGNALKPPAFTSPSSHGSSSLTLVNDEPGVCPRFTAQVIRGVRVGPSPDWLVRRLDAVGQRSINNVVDVTNYLTLEYGQPAHVFDLGRLEGSTLRIRFATEGEALTTLDGKKRTLKATDLVVADGGRAQSLAGVIGGADSEVTNDTTDVVLEVACWDPVTIRTAARRLDIRTDAGYRFERGVHPMALETPARRAAALIVELAGGSLEGDLLVEGAPDPAPVVVDLRPSRVSRLMGVPVDVGTMIGLLRHLEIDVDQGGEDTLRCTIPAHRLDLTREIDLVEEVI
ncbi:MAG: phenylalanine--tRNA ligase subunit beta, partial [Phycisphaerales bacterium]|nr:phenylalanine--tRNA ligase subunit beta [Phycisphaerales bacterium]